MLPWQPSAGYVVFSYDRLGYAKSNYFAQPAGGQTLTTAAHRAMLHDVVGDVRTRGYRVTAAADCSGATGPAGPASQKIVVIGHSAGGWVVAGYPGQYHDVSAMVEADISGNRHYALDGVRPGTRLAVVVARVHLGAAFHIGVNRWYVVSGPRSDGVLKVRRGVVEEVGIPAAR